MTYWTMSESNGIPAVTLCETHALEATNLPCALFGLGPYSTMEQAALELETLTAVFGTPDVPGFNFTTSDEGTCGACENGEPFDCSDITLMVIDGGEIQ